MKSYLPYASILTVLILLAMPDSYSTARVHKAPQPLTRQATPQLHELMPSGLSQAVRSVEVPPNCQKATLDVQTHDEEDNFGKDKPASKYNIVLSSQMLKYVKESGWVAKDKVKGYDEQRIDSVFADSFKLRNCRVCGATLEYRIEHDGSEWWTDSIKAGRAPFRQPDGKIFFTKADDKLYVWDWKKGMDWRKIEHPVVKTLKLPDTALNALNTYLATDPMPTYLDVLVEDDTFVDYMTLRVWYY